MIIVPDVMGVVVWSPLLDRSKNSVRGYIIIDMGTNLSDDSIFLVLSILSIFLVYRQPLNTTLKAILGPIEIDKGYIFK